MLTKSLKFVIAAFMLLSLSAEEISTIELVPGLWESTSTITKESGEVVHQESHQACITEDEASPSVQSILADLLEGDCELTGLVHTQGDARINGTCRAFEGEAVSVGEIHVTYTSTAYTAKADTTITGALGSVRVFATTKANRLGACSE
jgi:hypothetical protein